MNFENCWQALAGVAFKFGVSPEGIGFLFLWVSMGIGVCVSLATPAPPQYIQDLVESIRVPGTNR